MRGDRKKSEPFNLFASIYIPHWLENSEAW